MYVVGGYVSMLSKTLERYLREPDIVEGSGFRHFVGNRVLQFTYISNFMKKAKRSVASSLCQNHLYRFMSKPELLAKCRLHHSEDNCVL